MLKLFLPKRKVDDYYFDDGLVKNVKTAAVQKHCTDSVKVALIFNCPGNQGLVTQGGFVSYLV